MKTMTTATGEDRNLNNGAAVLRDEPQLELGLGSDRCQTAPLPARSRRQRHLNRALWWFRQMRQVVDLAADWQPAPQPRPEQTWFTQA